MAIYHLNCGTLSPRYARMHTLLYCLLVETSAGPVLVDTGLGAQDYERPALMVRAFETLMRAPGDVQETAVQQVQRLGYAPEQVEHIVLTHLHLDHAGGLADFPHAQVHVWQREYEAAMHHRGWLGRLSYQAAQWAHGPRWVLHDSPVERWYDFDALAVLPGITPRILLVPLPGHTPGHCGVAIQTERGWLFHCGDAASPTHPATDAYARPDKRYPLHWLPATPARWFFGRQAPRLQALAREHGDEVTVITGHDYEHWRELRGGAG